MHASGNIEQTFEPGSLASVVGFGNLLGGALILGGGYWLAGREVKTQG